MQVTKSDWGTKKFILEARWSKLKGPSTAELQGLETDWSNW